MRIDIRLPMGLMFTVIGAIMAVFGLVTAHSPIYQEKSLDINVNLWWGLALLVFGLLMLVLAWRATKRLGNSDEATEDPATSPAPEGQDEAKAAS